MKIRYGLLCVWVVMGGVAFASAPVLTWNPSGNTVWDLTSENWLDGGVPTAWVKDAVAKFDGGGGLVEVSADVSASGLVFDSGRYALVGYGRIRLEGDLFVAAGVTNSVGTELFSAGGITKKGGGAVALGMCVGRVTVAAGELLAVSSMFADAQVTVESGARLVTVGEPDRAQNLVRNAGFEEFNMASGAWSYVTTNLTEWGVAVAPNRVGGQNLAAAGSPWSSAGAAPEGNHVLILQMHGTVTQAVTVAQAGWHQIALWHFMRSGYAETLLHVTLDDVKFTLIINDAQEFAAQRFVSVPFWLEPGTYVLGLGGDDLWGDRASMVDDVYLGLMGGGGQVCRSLGGESSVSLLGGASAVLNHNGILDVGKLDVDMGASVTGGGSWSDAAMANFWFEYMGGAWSPTLAMGMDAFLRVRGSGALAAEGLARRVWVSDAANATLDGAGLTLTNAVASLVSRFTVDDSSTVRVTAPLALRQRTTFDVFGSLNIENSTVMTNALTSKRGFGAMAYSQPLALGSNMGVLEGRLGVSSFSYASGGSRNGCVLVLPLPGRSAEVQLQQANVTHTVQMYFGGFGEGILSTDFGGGSARIENSALRTSMPSPLRFDVAGGDALSIFRLLIWFDSSITPTGGLMKAGSGLLEIREGGTDTGGSRAYMGRTILRNGTLRVLVDDTGNTTGLLAYSGASLDGRGGSLGAGPLTDAVWVGDAGTSPGDDLTFTAVGNRRYIGHDFEVFDVGNDIRFEAENSTETMFAGTFTLHRDVTFAGNNDAHLILGAAVSSAGANLALEGFSRVTVLGALDGNISLDVGDRTLFVGSESVGVSTVGSFAMDGGTLGVNFEGGTCSRIDASDVTLGVVAFNLCYRGTDVPFGEPGVYTLFTASGTMDVQDLSIANEVPGFTYSLDASGGALTVTIQSATPGTYTAWASPQGGTWDTGANWNPAAVPNNSALSVLMGAAITENATVTLESLFTVGSLLFSHPTFAYTLEGKNLTLDGSPARLDVLSGSHVIKNTLDASGPLSVAVTGGKLTLDGQAVVLQQVLLEQGGVTLADEAALPGGVSLADAAALTISSTDSIIGTSLGGVHGAGLTLQSGSKLTVEQTVNDTFSGAIKGPADAEIAKAGSGVWELDAYDSFYNGAFRQAVGKTALASGTSLQGEVTVDAGATLTVAPAITNGLMGYYYIGNPTPSTNAFLSVAGIEALVAGRTPDLISPSGLDGSAFDYPLTGGVDMVFPYPFGKGGPNTVNFTAVWRGSITFPETGMYGFTLRADDYPLVAINGKVLFSNNRYESIEYYSTAEFVAGRHDILIALGQGGGNGGIQLKVNTPSAPNTQSYIPLPNTWLTPMTTLGSLNSKGQVAVQNNAGAFIGAAGASTLDGSLDTAADTLITKLGNASLDIRGGGSIAGDVVIREGRLLLAQPDLLGTANRVAVGAAASLTLLESQTFGGLEGAGTTSLGAFGDMGIDAFAFTDETDSDISLSKTYTHLVDFPLTQSPFATVNGVTFNKNTNWSFAGTTPTANQSAANEIGIERLLRGFVYGSVNFTVQLTGLQPFTAYETRFYFRNFGNNPREMTLTFTAGVNAVGAIDFNPDALPSRSQVRCRYITDVSGTLNVQIESPNSAHTCHLYAFSNEYLGAPSEAALTVAPQAGEDMLYAGAVSGGGMVVKDGAGVQRFSGLNSADGGLDVLAGEAVLNPGASVLGGAGIAAGATLTVPIGAVTLGGLTGGGTLDLAGPGSHGYQRGVYLHFFTNDVTSLISPSKVYTHKLDFGTRSGTTIGQNGATVNNVTFLKAGTSGISGGYGWDGFDSTHSGNASTPLPDTEDIYTLLTDMVNGNAQNTTATLTGLTPGKPYEVRFYNRTWNQSGNRRQTVRFTADPAVTNTITFNQETLAPNFVACRYTPTADTLTVIFGPHESGNTWHIHALTNEEVDGQDEEVLGVSIPLAVSPGNYPEETLYQHFFMDDATSQISPSKVYTHKLDFGGRDNWVSGTPGAVVNGVQFVKAGARGTVISNQRTYGWQGLAGGNHVGNDDASDLPLSRAHAVYDLMRDMTYGVGSGTAQLTGLTPGKEYEVRIYLRTWDKGLQSGRSQTVRFTADPAVTNTITFLADRLSPHFLAYRYTPTASTLTILYEANSGDTWHIYALTNEEVYRQDDYLTVLDVEGYDTFAGSVTGGQRWEKRGNGTLLMTGVSTATGLLTVLGGAFGVENGVATRGPVLVQDGLLFGHGTIGGTVSIEAGAGLHAGTENACGTLAIGGHLTIADGANLSWRYASKSAADAFTVEGLTFPNEGVLHAAPIASGATLPTKYVLFTSVTPINGPANLSDWVIDGIKGAQLEYNTARTQIILLASRGTVLIMK